MELICIIVYCMYVDNSIKFIGDYMFGFDISFLRFKVVWFVG